MFRRGLSQSRIRSNRRPGFTLIELLVVISIILLVSLIAIPVVYSSLNGRQVSDAGRIFTGGLVGIRDSAIKHNKPRGIRLLADPAMTLPPPGSSELAGTTQLCYNRYIEIEPAGNYSEGRVTIGPQYYAGGTPDSTTFPPTYTAPDRNAYQFPFVESPGISKVLMIEESPYVGGFASGLAEPRSPTGWYWNVRVGDKIVIGSSGRAYTIVGPCVVNPLGTGVNQGNPEMFVNVGPPGTPSPLERKYYPLPATVANAAALKPFATVRPEFLMLVNGENDTDDGYGHIGYTDEGFDGRNNDPPPPPGLPPELIPPYFDTLIDGPSEWEYEQWTASVMKEALQDTPTLTPLGSPSSEWVFSYWNKATQDVGYLIQRRAMPSPGAREVMLPAGTVIDATTWNSTRERSRIPVETGSLYCDILVDPAGQYVHTSLYSTQASADPLPFLHFWITSREGVHPTGTVPNTATSTYKFNLPMASTALGLSGASIVAPTTDGGFYPGTSGLPALTGDRLLVTMSTQSGLVTTNEIESSPPPNKFQAGEGFFVGDVNFPFYRAQQGARIAR